MRIGRTILALLIAVSVAMMPAAAGAGIGAKSPPAEISAADMPAVEGNCCPHKANPCDRADDCGTMATCALKCFSFAGTSLSTIVFPSKFAKIAVPFAGDSFLSQTGRPPFRPPRV